MQLITSCFWRLISMICSWIVVLLYLLPLTLYLLSISPRVVCANFTSFVNAFGAMNSWILTSWLVTWSYTIRCNTRDISPSRTFKFTLKPRSSPACSWNSTKNNFSNLLQGCKMWLAAVKNNQLNEINKSSLSIKWSNFSNFWNNLTHSPWANSLYFSLASSALSQLVQPSLPNFSAILVNFSMAASLFPTISEESQEYAFRTTE